MLANLPNRRSQATGPAATIPKPYVPSPPPGYTVTKDGPLVIFVRKDLGEGMVEPKRRPWASCHEHRLHLGENVVPAMIAGITPSHLPAKKPLVLPMHITPHPWRPHGS